MQAFAEQLVEAAYVEHRAPLVRHLTIVTRDSEVAQDLAHDAFLRLARAVEEGQAPDDAGAWLHRVGVNLAMSRGRHLQVINRRSQSLTQPSAAPNPESILVEGELTEAVAACLTELSGSERHALVLAAYGYGGTEIAASIGRTPGATRTLLCRARGKIRERILTAGLAPA
ncbi:MAG: sigma-70 family RNA polymerase sigma factor [Candidatus Limnocylindrales bacterium]